MKYYLPALISLNHNFSISLFQARLHNRRTLFCFLFHNIIQIMILENMYFSKNSLQENLVKAQELGLLTISL